MQEDSHNFSIMITLMYYLLCMDYEADTCNKYSVPSLFNLHN